MRVAVLGLGNAGFDIHLPALAALPGIAAVGVDPDPARRARAADRFGVPVFPSLDDAAAAARVDVVIVATPPASHDALCRRAFDLGADVLCEKPFALSVAEARGIVAAASAAGRRVALNHEFREMPIFRALRDELARPDTGGLVFAQAWQNMDLPPWKEPGWRGQLLTGTLYEAGLHLVDYLLVLFGEAPAAVSATMSSGGVRPEPSDALALVTMEFSRGRLGQVIQNRLCPGETQYFEVRADTERASLRASFGGRARVSAGLYRSTRPHLRLELGASGIAWSERGHARRMLAANPKAPAAAATGILIRKTLDAFASGGAPPASGEDGVRALEVLAACYVSADTGRRVAVDGADALRTFRFGRAPS